MRDLARAYRADGRDVAGIANGMRSTVRAMEFEGPAADRFEQKLRPRVKELRELAERLEELARLVDDTADEIERERRRRAERRRARRRVRARSVDRAVKAHEERRLPDRRLAAAPAARVARARGRLEGAAHGSAKRVREHPLPPMPRELAVRVSAEAAEIARRLETSWSPISTYAQELRVRALWAEVADARAHDRPSPTRSWREIFALMKDGSLLRYATDAQARWAGRLLGRTYRDGFQDPAKLVELAALLRANGEERGLRRRLRRSLRRRRTSPRSRASSRPWSTRRSSPAGRSLRAARCAMTSRARSSPASPATGTAAIPSATSSPRSRRRSPSPLERDALAGAAARARGRPGPVGGRDPAHRRRPLRQGLPARPLPERRRRPDRGREPRRRARGRRRSRARRRGRRGRPAGRPEGARPRRALRATTTPRRPRSRASSRSSSSTGPTARRRRSPTRSSCCSSSARYGDEGRALGEASASAVDGLHDDGEHGAANRITNRLVHEVVGGREDLGAIRDGVARRSRRPT